MRPSIPITLVAMIATGGCSLAFVSGPPANHRQLPAFNCTSSNVVPILDTLFTVLELANLGLAASSTDAEWDDRFGGDAPISRKGSIPLYAGMAALGAVGAYYGYTKTSACRAAKAESVLRGGGVAPGYGTWPPPGAAPVPPQPPIPPPPPPAEPYVPPADPP